METSNADRRQYERKAYGSPVGVKVDTLEYFVLLKDLSLGGAFIADNQLLPNGDEANISVTIPYDNKPGTVKLNGTIRRTTDRGIGIEFF